MGLLDEPGLDRLVNAGCPSCPSTRLTFRTYVDGLIAVFGGDPIARPVWVYDGEKFVDGVFEVACAACAHIVFAADVCPRCHAEDGLARALATTNQWPVPTSCASCEVEEVRYIAFLPARVTYEQRREDQEGVAPSSKPRASPARSTTELHEPGFHGYRVDCRDCGTVAELTTRCPLCEAPGPLRVRPG